MKVTVDEGVPRRLVRRLRDAGFGADFFRKEWTALGNGELLAAVEAAGYDRLVTNDKNLIHQRSLMDRRIVVIALPTNRTSDIVHRAEHVADTLRRSVPWQHVVMGMDGSRRVLRHDGAEVDTEAMPNVPRFGRG